MIPPRFAVARTIWGLAMWLAVVGNLPLWQRVHELTAGSARSIPVLAGIGLIVAGATAALLWSIAWPRLFLPMASLLVIAAAVGSYFMWQYGAVIDTTMLDNAINTDLREVRDLMSWSLPVALVAVAGPPLWWIWRRRLPAFSWTVRAWRNAAGVLLGVALALTAVMTGFQGLAPLVRENKALRYMINPLNTVYASARLAIDRIPTEVRAITPVGEDARPGDRVTVAGKPPLLLLVVGETARAANWGLNGYSRATTPALARWHQARGLVNFEDVTACGTSTQVSVPCLFSPLSREEGGGDTPRIENLLDVLHRAGLAVLWIDNQSGCKGVCDRVPSLGAKELALPGQCSDGECPDEIMLQGLEQRIESLDATRRARGIVIVLHQMGSHGPAYFKRTRAGQKPFQPECTRIALAECAREEVVNAYDNTIAATDRFLDQALGWLDRQAGPGGQETALLYLSDHGESLGESGLFLHGIPYALAPDEQKKVPMVAWLSEALQARTGIDVECLRERETIPHSHDNLFHSVLGLMDVRTRAYQPALDLFAPCSAVRRDRPVVDNARSTWREHQR